MADIDVIDPTGGSIPAAPEAECAIVLSVVVPVYNQAASIAHNVRVIRDSVAAGLAGATEVIVVSDGSLDDTHERALEVSDDRTRILHYDRNMGKGYAIKVGSLEARGRWVAYVDADLDLDPALLPAYVQRAEEAGLDFAIGSKRHPDAVVSYPRSRRIASWLFQRYVHALVRLDVRDTQVGIKVFRREVAEQVLPLLLVKRFAFDIELLAVARALGFGRIEEQPIRLDYRFTGSGVRVAAVVLALLDTLAVFYRLRILRYYQRKQRLVGTFGWTRPRAASPRVAFVGAQEAARALDYDQLELAGMDPAAAARSTSAPVLAVVEPGSIPATHWLSATVPFLARPEISAVVTPAVAPAGGGVRDQAAAAVRESRLGGGGHYFRSMPGNLRFVDDYATGTLVTRTELVRTHLDGVAPRDWPARLAGAGGRVLYTPEATVAARPEALFRPHLGWVAERARRRGRALRRRGPAGFRAWSLPPLLLATAAVAGWPVLLTGGAARAVWLGLWFGYALLLLVAGGIAAVRFSSLMVGALAVPGFVLTHAVYAASFVRGLVHP